MSNDTLKSAVSVLVSALKNDKDYRRTWVANIAMAFKDEIHEETIRMSGFAQSIPQQWQDVANAAANRFLDALCASKDSESADPVSPQQRSAVQTFIDTLSIRMIYGTAELKTGEILMVDYGCTPTERAGMMYRLKKLVDTELASFSIRHLKQVEEAEKAAEEKKL